MTVAARPAVTSDSTAWSRVTPALSAQKRGRVVTGIPAKTGVVWTLDRETGEFLWGTPCPTTSSPTSTAPSGAVAPNREFVFMAEGQRVLVRPRFRGERSGWRAPTAG